MSLRSVVVVCLWTLVAVGTAAAQTSPFKLEPALPKVGEPFQVIFAEAADTPEGVKYDWFVNAREGGAAVEPAEAGIPDMAPSEPKLTIAKARANTSYRIVLVRMVGGSERVLPTLSLRFDAQQLVAEPAATPAPPAVIPPAPTVGAAPAPTTPLPPDPSPGESVNQKLLSARIWADGIATAPKSSDLVLPVEYFQLALSKPRQDKLSLRTRTQTPLLDAVELYRAMDAAVKRVPAGAPSEQLVAAWMEEKQRFLTAMDAYGQTDKTKLAWNEFVDEWQQEVNRVAPGRFREALVQAGLIVTAVLLEHEKRHIEAALTTGARVASASRAASGATTYGSSYGYAPSHAAGHHARAMSRIHFRHQRRMARIGY